MKSVRLVLLPLLMAAFVTAVSAPVAMSATSTSTKTAKTPDEMATEALSKWKTTLKLTDEQAPQFETIMKDSYQKMADAKTAAAGDKAKMKESMESIMKDRSDALSKVLTPDQMKTYEAQTKKNMSAAKKKMSKSAAK